LRFDTWRGVLCRKIIDPEKWARLITDPVCSDQMKRQLLEFTLFTRNIAVQIAEGRPEAFSEATKEFAAKLNTTTKAQRNELGS
jgi:hypothetical protein